MNNQNNQNGRGIFYGVIGVATLVVAIIGATFAYFTASQENNNVITGNAATISFDLKVERAETGDAASGLIPMSNSMVETAVSKNDVCKDDNGNSVCQVYKITVTNGSSASMFLDGYVTLANDIGGPLGTSTDVTYTNAGAETVMRWAQVFTNSTKYTTAGKTTTTANAADVSTPGFANSTNAWATLAFSSAEETTYKVPAAEQGKNIHNILGGGKTYTPDSGTALTSPATLDDIAEDGTIQGNTYDIINRNYIRISDHNPGSSYTRGSDLTSALVFNQYLEGTNAGDTDEVILYIVVWLSETGTNQNPDKSADATTRNGIDFFQGTVTFLSAQGGEVTATFSNYATVAPTDTAGAQATTTTTTTS